jgi:hypothetical protein
LTNRTTEQGPRRTFWFVSAPFFFEGGNAVTDDMASNRPANLLAEELLTLPEAAKLLPPLRLGRPVTGSALWRWAVRGVRLSSGSRLKLEIIAIGSRVFTSREALERLCERKTADALAFAAKSCQAFGQNTD